MLSVRFRPSGLQTPKNTDSLIPLLDHHQACHTDLYFAEKHAQNRSQNTIFIAVSKTLIPHIGATTFAFKIADESMIPEMQANDVLIIEPSQSPKQGDYVAVKINGKEEIIICQYRKLSYISSEFELITLNKNWPDIAVSENIKISIIGKVIQNIRTYA